MPHLFDYSCQLHKIYIHRAQFRLDIELEPCKLYPFTPSFPSNLL
jgi:hypothetical protein